MFFAEAAGIERCPRPLLFPTDRFSAPSVDGAETPHHAVAVLHARRHTSAAATHRSAAAAFSVPWSTCFVTNQLEVFFHDGGPGAVPAGAATHPADGKSSGAAKSLWPFRGCKVKSTTPTYFRLCCANAKNVFDHDQKRKVEDGGVKQAAKEMRKGGAHQGTSSLVNTTALRGARRCALRLPLNSLQVVSCDASVESTRLVMDAAGASVAATHTQGQSEQPSMPATSPEATPPATALTDRLTAALTQRFRSRSVADADGATASVKGEGGAGLREKDVMVMGEMIGCASSLPTIVLLLQPPPTTFSKSAEGGVEAKAAAPVTAAAPWHVRHVLLLRPCVAVVRRKPVLVYHATLRPVSPAVSLVTVSPGGDAVFALPQRLTYGAKNGGTPSEAAPTCTGEGVCFTVKERQPIAPRGVTVCLQLPVLCSASRRQRDVERVCEAFFHWVLCRGTIETHIRGTTGEQAYMRAELLLMDDRGRLYVFSPAVTGVHIEVTTRPTTGVKPKDVKEEDSLLTDQIGAADAAQSVLGEDVTLLPLLGVRVGAARLPSLCPPTSVSHDSPSPCFGWDGTPCGGAASRRASEAHFSPSVALSFSRRWQPSLAFRVEVAAEAAERAALCHTLPVPPRPSPTSLRARKRRHDAPLQVLACTPNGRLLLCWHATQHWRGGCLLPVDSTSTEPRRHHSHGSSAITTAHRPSGSALQPGGAEERHETDVVPVQLAVDAEVHDARYLAHGTVCGFLLLCRARSIRGGGEVEDGEAKRSSSLPQLWFVPLSGGMCVSVPFLHTSAWQKTEHSERFLHALTSSSSSSPRCTLFFASLSVRDDVFAQPRAYVSVGCVGVEECCLSACVSLPAADTLLSRYVLPSPALFSSQGATSCAVHRLVTLQLLATFPTWTGDANGSDDEGQTPKTGRSSLPSTALQASGAEDPARSTALLVCTTNTQDDARTTQFVPYPDYLVFERDLTISLRGIDPVANGGVKRGVCALPEAQPLVKYAHVWLSLLVCRLESMLAAAVNGPFATEGERDGAVEEVLACATALFCGFREGLTRLGLLREGSGSVVHRLAPIWYSCVQALREAIELLLRHGASSAVAACVSYALFPSSGGAHDGVWHALFAPLCDAVLPLVLTSASGATVLTLPMLLPYCSDSVRDVVSRARSVFEEAEREGSLAVNGDVVSMQRLAQSGESVRSLEEVLTCMRTPGPAGMSSLTLLDVFWAARRLCLCKGPAAAVSFLQELTSTGLSSESVKQLQAWYEYVKARVDALGLRV